MDSKKLALLCKDLAENKKAEHVAVLDVRKLSTVTDFFVIATGSSEPHLRAITNEIADTLRKDYELRCTTEGDLRMPWQVLDFFDVIVHVMRDDIRQKYDLEGLWGDAPQVKPATKPKPKPKPRKARVARKKSV